MTFLWFREAQGATADREISTRRNEIEVVPLERHSVCCLLYRHRRMAGQQIDHHARMGRIEMLDQNKRHAAAGREAGEQPPGSIKPSSRGAEPDDREVVMRKRRAEPRRRAPTRRPRSRSGLSRTLSYHSIDPTTKLCVPAMMVITGQGSSPNPDDASRHR